jgi:hypothetical protein
MTRDSARTAAAFAEGSGELRRSSKERRLANTILGVAAVAAAVAIARTPRLRRIAVTLATTALTTTLPGLLLREIRLAWEESGRAA